MKRIKSAIKKGTGYIMIRRTRKDLLRSKRLMAGMSSLVVFLLIFFTTSGYYLGYTNAPGSNTNIEDAAAAAAGKIGSTSNCYKWDFNNYSHGTVITSLSSTKVNSLDATSVGVTYKHNEKPSGDYVNPYKVLSTMVIDPYKSGIDASNKDFQANTGKVLILDGGNHNGTAVAPRSVHHGGDLIFTFNSGNVTQVKFDTIDAGDEFDEKGRINNNYYTVVTADGITTDKVGMDYYGQPNQGNGVKRPWGTTKDYGKPIKTLTVHFSGSAALDNLEICNKPVPTTPPATQSLACTKTTGSLVDYSQRGSNQGKLQKNTKIAFNMTAQGTGLQKKEVCFSGILDNNKATAWKCLREVNNTLTFANPEVDKSQSNLTIADLNNITFEEIKNNLSFNSSERTQIDKNGINWGFNVFDSQYKCEGSSGKVYKISDGSLQTFNCLNGNVAFQNTCGSKLYLAQPVTPTPVTKACTQYETKTFHSGEFVAHNTNKRSFLLGEVAFSDLAKKYDIKVRAYWGWTGDTDQLGGGKGAKVQNNEKHTASIKLIDNQSSATKTETIFCDDLGNTLLYNDGTAPISKITPPASAASQQTKFLKCRKNIAVEANNGTEDFERKLNLEGKYDKISLTSILDYTAANYDACMKGPNGNQKKCAQSHYSKVEVEYCIKEV